jgi:ParB family transcriptional regulator, chromosome partitioning protein
MFMPQLYSNSIFWIEVEKIQPNPYQPRREFEQDKLRDLADSIRQYGVLQPLVVSRVEHQTPDGGLTTEYELIAGERRLRASKLAGLAQVPVIIRVGDDSMMKLEIAIIENLQREDLNAVERARAFIRLADEFHFTHAQIGAKVGKSREYVSNTLRLLSMPQEILDALSAGKISEGHTRPLMMLSDRPEEQMVLFKEIVYKRITVREAERLARRIAVDKIRKKEYLVDPEVVEMERELREHLGTRVHIEKRTVGGEIRIDFFSNDDLHTLLDIFKSVDNVDKSKMLEQFIASQSQMVTVQAPELSVEPTTDAGAIVQAAEELTAEPLSEDVLGNTELLDDRSKDEVVKAEEVTDDADLYNLTNFSL